MLLNRRLAYAQRVNAVADGLNRLGHSLGLQVGQQGGLHGHAPRVAAAGSDVILRQVVLHDAQQIAARGRRNALQRQVIGIVLRIGLRNVGPVDLVAAQLLLEHINGILRVHVDRVVDLHLQDQMGSAAQIETQLDALGHGVKQALPGKAARDAENSEDKNQQYGDDADRFVEKILSHDKLS